MVVLKHLSLSIRKIFWNGNIILSILT